MGTKSCRLKQGSGHTSAGCGREEDMGADRVQRALRERVVRKKQGEKTIIQCKVNGVQRSFDGDPEVPLLRYLRDQLHLTGSKYGCGIGLCGACTVHVDGAAMRSCLMLMSSAAGKDIVTIEGLSANGDHPVQQAWKAFNVPQCGYCQSWQIMQAVALLKDKPKPTNQDIDAAMQGNIWSGPGWGVVRRAFLTSAGIQEGSACTVRLSRLARMHHVTKT
jgi:isoquinoline 1-oxidoreductase alpha subunit